MKKTLIVAFLFLSFNSLSKDKLDSVWVSPNSYYISKGKITTLINQSQYKNWIAGGVNNLFELELSSLVTYLFLMNQNNL